MLSELKVLRCSRDSVASDHLDMMRAIAAIEVMLSHGRTLFLMGGSELKSPSKLLQILYLATGWSHPAVVVFFVLSGFFVGGSVLAARDRWSWRSYGLARGTRLYLVLIPALLLTVLWDHAGMATGSNIYDNTHGTPIVPYVVSDHMGPTHFWGNWVFLQSLTGKPAGVFPYGSNSALWSLSNEFWYYLLFPLFMLALISSRTSRRGRIISLAVGGVLAATVCRHLLPGFAIWLLGAGVALLPDFKLKKALALPLVGTLLVVLAGALIFARDKPSFLPQATLSLIAAATIYAIIIAKDAVPAPKFYGSVARTLAGFSYTLYAVHLPLLVFLRAWLYPNDRLYPTGQNLLIYAGLCLSAMAYAAILSLVTEAQTDRVRKALDKITAPKIAA